ncbi:MAG: chemoreceptor glutamine deamidase CheD [Rhodanobacter sp.]|jgi:chemotaxis protein CheD|uniref:Probable chemoreceptor glutamine deamidase CheD n=2 Tax=unclassified Rhodanobacter TaxID=2621553 RepID=A0AB74UW71_9GAMM|nr:chemoreceptor glutamine deamidase CheD [Rhodanobacter sp.]ODT93685.1 MAG: chemotaxis protein CheD [Rhodanobacter sp. SCN 67-45]OJW41298.1 MAG: chemotaxis protein CheD [Rhodanobacter sp. 67-28]
MDVQLADRRKAPAISAAPPGFEHLRRFWDPAQGCMTVKVLPGEFYVSDQEEMLSTVLGSCVSACIHDVRRGIGGMNHFMLPEPVGERDNWSSTVGRAARYGSDAMEQLINAILKAGGQRADLRVKVFGGGRVLARMSDVGQRNIEFVRRYIAAENLELVASDLGDVFPRQVQFFPHSGRARVRLLRRSDDVALVAGESGYLKRLANDPIKGEVELF